MIKALKRLSGAKDVTQGDFRNGVGTYVVSFGEMPKIKVADVTALLGNFELQGLGLRISAKVTSKEDNHYAGPILLADPKEGDKWLDDVERLLKEGKDTMIVSGALTEDDKGNQTLTLSEVSPAGKK